MGIRDFFRRTQGSAPKPPATKPAPEPAVITDEQIKEYAARMFREDILWVIEVFDPDFLDPMTDPRAESPILMGPWKSAMYAAELLEMTLHLLNQPFADHEPQYTGRIRQCHNT